MIHVLIYNKTFINRCIDANWTSECISGAIFECNYHSIRTWCPYVSRFFDFAHRLLRIYRCRLLCVCLSTSRRMQLARAIRNTDLLQSVTCTPLLAVWIVETRITPSNDVIINVSDTDGFASILWFHEPTTPLLVSTFGRPDWPHSSFIEITITYYQRWRVALFSILMTANDVLIPGSFFLVSIRVVIIFFCFCLLIVCVLDNSIRLFLSIAFEKN